MKQWAGLGLGWVCAGSLLSAGEPLRVLSHGHYDLGAHYDPASGWHAYVWDFDAGRALPTESTILRVAPSLRRELGNELPAFAAPSTPVSILPGTAPSDLLAYLYLGFGTQQQQPQVFTGGMGQRGRKSMRLISVEGPAVDRGGHFALYYFDRVGIPEWIFNTRNGIDENDSFSDLIAGFHDHYNFAFTEAGRYEVKVEFRGVLRSEHGGGTTAHQVTWVFHVGDGRLAWTQATEGVDGWWISPSLGRFFPLGADWIYHETLGFLYQGTTTENAAVVFRPSDNAWYYLHRDIFPWTLQLQTNEWVLAPAQKRPRS